MITGISTDLPPWGIVTLFVLLIAFGALIPRWTHNRMIHDKDVTIAYLRATAEKRDEQVGKLVEHLQLTIKLLEDLKAEARRR